MTLNDDHPHIYVYVRSDRNTCLSSVYRVVPAKLREEATGAEAYEIDMTLTMENG